jgi:hypothetical protein
MKRTRELTSIHYRRSVKRRASVNVQSRGLQSHCPSCGTSLEVVLVSDPGYGGSPKAAQKIGSHLAQQECHERSNEDSENQHGLLLSRLRHDQKGGLL